MTDLVDQNAPTHSPKRKFSFRFGNMSHSAHDKDINGSQINGNHTMNHSSAAYLSKERRNFSEEVKNVPDLQSTITEDHRLAYKSLVEDPKELMYMKPSTTLNHSVDFGVCSISTLPRMMTAPSTSSAAPKSATLSKLFSKKSKESSVENSSPLKILRDKSFPLMKPRLKILASVGDESVNSQTFLLGDGEPSPSYVLSSPAYTFSQKDLNMHEDSKHNSSPLKASDNSSNSNNPLPLPPRDRNATQQQVQKRHVRKYPLIIPATGLQKTLADKLNSQVTPVEEKEIFSKTNGSTIHDLPVDEDDDDVFENCKSISLSHNVNDSTNKIYKKDFIENNFPSTSHEATKGNQMEFRTYENLSFHNQFMTFSVSDDCDDTASLHFESILENDDNRITISPIPDDMVDMVDGFGLFNVEKEQQSINGSTLSIASTSAAGVIHSGNSKVSAVLINSDKKVAKVINPNIEAKRQEFSQKFPKYKMPKNELASNALFNKIKESVESAIDTPTSEEFDLKKSINHVSCEDLLDFSDKKPKGKERGVESDEVRIMSKVLGTKVQPDRCLLMLEFIDWDVHKAIKLSKLQNIYPHKSLQDCFDDLEESDWDVNQAAAAKTQ